MYHNNNNSNDNIDLTRYQKKIGCSIQIPKIGRGELKYVGPVSNKQGIFVGVDLLANIGKNNGSFEGRVYFKTEYPSSGLFIQLSKVAKLIDNASFTNSNTHNNATSSVGRNSSRRNTLNFKSSNERKLITNSLPRSTSRISSHGSTGSTIIRRQGPILSANSNNHQYINGTGTANANGGVNAHDNIGMDLTMMKSPTPMRFESQQQSRDNANDDDLDTDMDMDIDPPSSAVRRSLGLNIRTEDHTQISMSNEQQQLIRDYEIKIDKQRNEISQYKKLLDDQRMVLEEIQPTIDQYEKNLHDMELQLQNVNNQLNQEREQQLKQKQFFETEHEQLLAVIDQLHEEIKENEKQFININNNKSIDTHNNNNNVFSDEEFKSIKNELELLKISRSKWDKEREQLKMHNTSLSKELMALMNADINNDDDIKKEHGEIEELKKEMQKLQSELKEANMQLAKLPSSTSSSRMPNNNETKSAVVHSPKNNITIESLPIYKPDHPIDASAGRELWCALCEREGHESIDCPFEIPRGEPIAPAGSAMGKTRVLIADRDIDEVAQTNTNTNGITTNASPDRNEALYF
ncbi:Bik1p NDAI_0A00460 [Naumovozyma dairenensis CBS 421]|uniref:CAP-Gly domain-containing protein n=1 Tax=Naumovozyma dairenensis (strain ATCC 10597 / BCRC 20456 / CBS 421 / NBRC 0211 / NRRL Y-12639) TaxID=1071378 RepID=G0W316_NAUDC|nr:hypothetical protein NDAI_0A00460 [Naumovozyma dairenensis CBS 421]CCD22204.1 hypothetical protein NDAI_0A00460 [Naumovozyma dairenensis CBS 421]